MAKRSARYCVVCGESYVPTYGAQRTCGRECGWVINRQRRWPVERIFPATCLVCGRAFVSRHQPRTLCSSECRRERRRAYARGTRIDSRDERNWNPGMPMRKAGTFIERLMSRFKIQPDGCWLWLGTVAGGSGYGQINRDGRNVMAHRAMWEHLRETIPDGLDLDHLCRVRLCVNPDHLEPVTRAENNRRARLTRSLR